MRSSMRTISKARAIARGDISRLPRVAAGRTLLVRASLSLACESFAACFSTEASSSQSPSSASERVVGSGV